MGASAGVSAVSYTHLEGTYRLSITFAAGTDADLAAIDVQNRVAQALAQLPAEVQQNGVQVRKRASNLLMG